MVLGAGEVRHDCLLYRHSVYIRIYPALGIHSLHSSTQRKVKRKDKRGVKNAGPHHKRKTQVIVLGGILRIHQYGQDSSSMIARRLKETTTSSNHSKI